jgi:hypothetical protein
VPLTWIFENFGCDTGTTSIDPSTSSLFVQSSPAFKGGSTMFVKPPA